MTATWSSSRPIRILFHLQNKSAVVWSRGSAVTWHNS